MRFPDLYIERQRMNDKAWDKVHSTDTGFASEEFRDYQAVLRESYLIIDSIPPNDWGLEDGTLIYLTGDTGQGQEMYRIYQNEIEFHDRKDYWFHESKLSAYDLVSKIRRGAAMLLQETKPSFDNWEDGL